MWTLLHVWRGYQQLRCASLWLACSDMANDAAEQPLQSPSTLKILHTCKTGVVNRFWKKWTTRVSKNVSGGHHNMDCLCLAEVLHWAKNTAVFKVQTGHSGTEFTVFLPQASRKLNPKPSPHHCYGEITEHQTVSSSSCSFRKCKLPIQKTQLCFQKP